jgi:hypothetical protein
MPPTPRLLPPCIRGAGLGLQPEACDRVACSAVGTSVAIHRIYHGGWFVGRPTLEELRQDLRAMMRVYHLD